MVLLAWSISSTSLLCQQLHQSTKAQKNKTQFLLNCNCVFLFDMKLCVSWRCFCAVAYGITNSFMLKVFCSNLRFFWRSRCTTTRPSVFYKLQILMINKIIMNRKAVPLPSGVPGRIPQPRLCPGVPFDLKPGTFLMLAELCPFLINRDVCGTCDFSPESSACRISTISVFSLGSLHSSQ